MLSAHPAFFLSLLALLFLGLTAHARGALAPSGGAAAAPGAPPQGAAAGRAATARLTACVSLLSLAMLSLLLLSSGATVFATQLKPRGAAERFVFPPEDPSQPLQRPEASAPDEPEEPRWASLDLQQHAGARRADARGIVSRHSPRSGPVPGQLRAPLRRAPPRGAAAARGRRAESAQRRLEPPRRRRRIRHSAVTLLHSAHASLRRVSGQCAGPSRRRRPTATSTGRRHTPSCATAATARCAHRGLANP